MKYTILAAIAFIGLAWSAQAQTIKFLGYDTTNGIVAYSGTKSLAFTNSVTFSNVTSTGTLIIASPTVPAATNSTGVKGQIAFTNNFLYICVASNTWRRIQLGTWE